VKKIELSSTPWKVVKYGFNKNTQQQHIAIQQQRSDSNRATQG